MGNEFDELADLISKQKGCETSYLGTDLRLASHIPYGIPSRIPQLDLSIGRPGYPAGRIIELFGFESTGKSTAGLHAISEMQRMGGFAQLYDVEHCFDPVRAEECGVDPDKLLVTEPDSLEDIFTGLDSTLDSLEKANFDKPFLAVVDTVCATVSAVDMKKDLEKRAQVADAARIVRRGLQQINHKIADRKATIIMVNHAIAKIGVSFGEQSMSASGHAIKYWAAVRVDFGFMSTIKSKDKENAIRLGQVVKMRVKKNKINHTSQSDFNIPLTEHGFDLNTSLFEAFLTMGLMKQVKGRTYHFDPTDTTLVREEWNNFVESRGGSLTLYDWFLKEASKVINPRTNRPFIRPYGEVVGCQDS